MTWSPGWYPDPWNPGSNRWWDGQQWTHQTSAADRPAGARKRRVWPWLVGGALLLLLMAGGAVALIAAIASDDEEVARPARPQRAVPPDGEPRSNRLPPVDLGESVTLRDQDGQRVRVTVTGVKDPVPRGDYFRGPKRGTRWVGVQMRFQGEGPGVYDDSVSNGLRVATGQGSYEADFSELAACRPVRGGNLNLSPGESTAGCIVIPVPRGEDPETVRFTPSSGFSPDVGTWRVP